MPIYMKFDGGKVEGNVTAKGYEKCIELHSISWTVNRVINTRTGNVTDREKGAATISEMNAQKAMDASSVKLLQEALTGNAVPVVITFLRTGSPMVKYLEYTLEDCLISNISYGSGGDDPQESLSLSFTKFTYDQNSADGKNKGTDSVKVTYDLATAQLGS
jgi:type VI secretion system secreted protein Hcp